MRIPLATLVYLSSLFCFVPHAIAYEGPESYFFIISVPPPKGFEELPSLQARADALKSFVQATYQADDEHVLVFDKPWETDSISLRTILYKRIPELPPDSLIFFFLLTHAHLQQYPNPSPAAGSDLQIVVSDTVREQLAGTTIHGTELISAFSQAPRRSFVFAFLDSCDSGGIGTSLNRLIGFLSNNYLESKMLVMTSSAEWQPSYAGNFTQALIDVWKEQGPKCIKDDYFVDALNRKLPSRKQEAQIIIPFAGPCLNFANENIGLLVVSNNTNEAITLEFSDDLDSITVGKENEWLVPIPRSIKKASVFGRRNRAIGTIEFDLSQNPVARYRIPPITDEAALGQPIDTEQLAQEYLSTAERVSNFGFDREAQAYKLFAAGLIRQTGKEQEAQEIEASIDRSVASEEVLAALNALDNPGEIKPESLGDFLVGAGKFEAAYPAYFAAFQVNEDPEIFGGLYTSLVVSGKEEAAKELRIENSSIFALSEEALTTRGLINWESRTNVDPQDITALYGMERAAARTGLVVTGGFSDLVPTPDTAAAPPNLQ